ncbi:MAG: guanylate kinase [Peptostreptococcaceae bacterium]|nr:guanylate kinase [Peptostreptococcaceae bacterium]MDY5739220.1 guanylate kinase [Anaerovoracaceae bacterium]SFE56929.1 guanylate kinase [Peptostreptococcaceae bacterium pGA-8]
MSSKQKGKLFVISGPSGAGKGTICKKIIDETDVKLSVSMTTRAPRPGEVDGINYFFTDKEAFMKEIREDGFIEYAEVYGNYYGTPKAEVFEMLDKGIDIILEIDIQGALKVKETMERGVFIFILPPSMHELRKRITGRGSETEEVINMRLSQTLNELSYIDRYDYCVVNGELDEAVNRVKAIITAEHSKVTEDIKTLIENYEEEKV